VTTEAEQETLHRMSDEVDEVIASFAQTYAQMAELQRVLQRTCRRAEDALALAQKIRRLRL
jgi:phage shock protein A